MLKNYFKTALRNIVKNKLHSSINIAGLSVGMAVAIIIGLWIWDELSFNKYHQNYGRIAELMEQRTNNGEINTNDAVALPLKAAIEKSAGSDFTGIVRTSWLEDHILASGDKKISFKGNYMDAGAPKMFTLHMAKGNVEGLKGISSIFISQSTAKAMFGDAEPIGRVVKLDNAASFSITGIYSDLPENTTLHGLDFIAPWDYFVASHDWVKGAADDWNDASFHMYVQLTESADINSVAAKIRNDELKNVIAEDAKYKPAIILHPMSKWHLYSQFKNGVNTGGAVEYVWLFGIIGLFVLLLACINFMNLSTARSEKRAKEVGIRKAIGSLRSQLISQFFCESLLMSFAAFFLSLSLVSLVLPYFNSVAAKQMTVPWGNTWFWLIAIAFTLFTGIIAGTYPALYLSSFKPVKVLKGTFKAGRFSAMPRKALVVLQFAVSVILIVGTIVVFKQIQFAKNRPVGYSREGLMYIQVTNLDLHSHFGALRQELLSSGAITDMTETSSPMTAIENNRSDLDWKEKDPNTTYNFSNIRISGSYGKTAAWQVIAGRDFSNILKSDSDAVILNETAVKYMGLKQPLGEIITFGGKPHSVIGVTKDMVMQSPYEPARQTIFYISRDGFDYIMVRIKPQVSAHNAIAKIEAACKKYSPTVPFSYSFTDTQYDRKFNTEERIGNLAAIFAMLAIFISCLGLSGMASFMAEQRTKEIGVRKVLGASAFNVWQLMNKEFVLLVTVALLVAIPVSYTVMNNWLLNYQYHTTISWWVFAITAAGAIFITLTTVSYQAVKAALMNPVKSLKTE